MTSNPCVPAHMNAQITASGKKNPSALPALIPAIFTFGATPTMPMPLDAAAIVPAVWVPWPLSSFAATSPGTATPLTQLALSALSTFAARSGCVKSRPVSMSPTSTSELPPVIAWACGAWICTMSNCSPDRLSESVAGALGRAGSAPVIAPSSSWTPKPAVDCAPWIRLSRSRFARNVELSQVAIATPICL